MYILATIEESEYPTNFKNINITAETVILTHDKIDCEEFNGPLFISTITKCYNDWCKKDIIKNFTHTSILSASLPIDSLIPYSNYTTIIGISRKNSGTAARTFTTHFQTLPSCKY